MGRFLFVVSIGVWLGMVVSFTHLIVPVIRATMHPEAAVELLRNLFPRYYTLGLLCGLTGLAAVSLAPHDPALSVADRLLLAFPVSLSLLCTVLAQYYVHPRMAEFHGHAPDDHDRLVWVSALLNNTVLFMLVLAFGTFVTR